MVESGASSVILFLLALCVGPCMYEKCTGKDFAEEFRIDHNDDDDRPRWWHDDGPNGEVR